jgi:hypothetical protein
MWNQQETGSTFFRSVFQRVADCTASLPNLRFVCRLSQIAALRIFKLWLHPDWLFHLTPLGRDQARHLRYTDSMTSAVSVKHCYHCYLKHPL